MTNARDMGRLLDISTPRLVANILWVSKTGRYKWMKSLLKLQKEISGATLTVTIIIVKKWDQQSSNPG